MSVMTTGDFGAFLFPLLKLVFGHTYDEVESFHQRMVDVEDSDKEFEDYIEIATFGDVPKHDEGTAITLDTARQSYRTRYEMIDYAMGFEVTRPLMRGDQTRAIRMLPEELGKAVRRTVENMVAGLFNDGFDATITHPTEGQPLFSTSHPTYAGNRKNRPATNTDPTMSGWQQMQIDQADMRDARGNRVSCYITEVFGNPFNQSTFKRITQSPDDPSTAARSINPFHRSADFFVNPYLTSQKAWFGKTNIKGSTLHWREHATFSEMAVEDMLKRRYMVHFAVSGLLNASGTVQQLWHNWRFAYGSPGITGA